VAEDFAQDFVTPGNFRLASQAVPVLRLNHHHGRFGVAATVIMVKEFVATKPEVMQHLFKHSTDTARGVLLELDEWLSANLFNRVMAIAR
jgi:hypothetical protein